MPGARRSPELPRLPGAARGSGPSRAEGRVTDADSRQPIPGATVAFMAPGASASARTDGRGYYAIELSGGRYRTAVTAPGFVAPTDAAQVSIEERAQVSGLDFVLYRTATVAGRVVTASRTVLRGAHVRVQRARAARRMPPSEEAVQTDAQGRFSLVVPPGEVVLRAEADALGAALSTPFYVRGGAHLTGIEIVLGAGLTVSGQVVSPGGEPAAAAQVLLQDELGSRRLAVNARGEFTAGGLQVGRKWLQALGAGFGPSRVSEVEVRPGGHHHLRLVLTAAKGLAGRVVDANDQPVPGARISVRPGGPGQRMVSLAPTLRATCDADGAFNVPAVPDLPLVVTAHGADGASVTRVGVAPGSTNLVLKLQVAGAVFGQVTDGLSGRPIQSFTVALEPRWGGGPGRSPRRLRVASASGSYELADVMPGAYRLVVTAPRYGPAAVEQVAVVSGHRVQANLVLDEGGRVAGVVVDPRGAGVPGAEVRMDTGWAGRPALTDATGRFLLEDVGRGRRSLSVTHRDYDTRILPGVSVFNGQTAEVRVELAVRAGAGASVRFSGVGIVLQRDQGRLAVMRVLSGSPAALAGVLAGDLILAIDSRTTERMSFDDAIEAIRGIVGTPVRLRLQRAKQSFDVDLLRQEVNIPGKS
ncbi:MAG: carboxypeptidase regulatory-like domain-containing protein [Deltaproteobacteria bacterium]|nr:carboxypeptidase regulatory-like domain-containing protein [Deltaproteobacteria bacterium]